MVDVRKNRFDGDLGKFQITFDQATQLYQDELSNDDAVAIHEDSVEGHHTQPEARGEAEKPRPEIMLDEIIMS